MKLYGNMILMATICIVIFWFFMALRPVQAGEGDFVCGKLTGFSSTGGLDLDDASPLSFKIDPPKPRRIIIRYDRKTGALRINGKRCQWGE